MIKKFTNETLLAKYLAKEILEKLKINKKLVLGCPGGRSLKKTYYYMGILSYKFNINLNNLIIIMMDEYVVKKNGKYKLVDKKSHFSCVRFSSQNIKKSLNYKKNTKNKLISKNILFPNNKKPKKFYMQIKKLGGIDIFLLASGSSDGHVAFNNKFSNLKQSTHITKLSKKTRNDNMKTFPNFKKLSEVPKYGLTVGLKTIYSLSKSAILVLAGKDKYNAFNKIYSLNKYSKEWPASIIFKCRNFKIYTENKVFEQHK